MYWHFKSNIFLVIQKKISWGLLIGKHRWPKDGFLKAKTWKRTRRGSYGEFDQLVSQRYLRLGSFFFHPSFSHVKMAHIIFKGEKHVFIKTMRYSFSFRPETLFFNKLCQNVIVLPLSVCPCLMKSHLSESYIFTVILKST